MEPVTDRKPAYIFSIKNLIWKYGDREVLHVPRLGIERGKLVIILGKSGSGKSTLLELMGLMSHQPPQKAITFFPAPGEAIDYYNLWQTRERLHEIRRKHFSFIFQHDRVVGD